MNFQFFVEKLRSSDSYKDFTSKNNGVFPCSCFFIIDLEKGQDKQHFDFYIPKDKKMLSFQLEKECEIAPVETFDNKTPKKISFEHKFDFNELRDLIIRRMEKENINSKIQKMLFSLQNKNDRDFLIGTIFISRLGILRVEIDLEKRRIVDFAKRSFFDMVNIKKGGKDK